MKKKQIYFTSPGIAELLVNELSALAPDDVLVEMEYTAISGGTERACLMGSPNVNPTFPMSLGYCGIGYVREIGSAVKGYTSGDRVLVYHGCHTTHNVVKEHQLTKVADDAIPSKEAAFVIIASMSLGGVRKLKIEIGEAAMVMGLGILGIFAVQFCRLNGAYPVIAADPNEERRKKALALGADYAFDPLQSDFAEKVKAVTGGKGVNATVEVTGVSAALRGALSCTAPLGRIALLGCTRVSDSSIDYYTQVHRPGITLIGAHNFVRPKTESYPHHWTHQDDCNAILNLIAAKRIDAKGVLNEIVLPEEATEVYHRLAADQNFPVGVLFDWRSQNG